VLLFTSGLGTPPHYDFTNFSHTDPATRRGAPSARPRRSRSTSTSSIPKAWGLQEPDRGRLARPILIAMVLIFNLGARFIGRLLTRRLTAA
jgi:hypothetical protein